jgi:hypothetical protein
VSHACIFESPYFLSAVRTWGINTENFNCGYIYIYLNKQCQKLFLLIFINGLLFSGLFKIYDVLKKGYNYKFSM